jgi:hypothetical protein
MDRNPGTYSGISDFRPRWFTFAFSEKGKVTYDSNPGGSIKWKYKLTAVTHFPCHNGS